MFCQHCGNEIPDNTKFCHFCGKEQAPVAQPVTQTPPPAASASQAPKKKKNPIVSIVIVATVFLVFYFIGKSVMAPSLSKDNSTSAVSSSDDSSYEFEEVPEDAVQPYSNVTYTMTDENGGTYRMMFFYLDDIIHTIRQTYTLSTEGFDEETMNTFQQYVDEAKATCEPYDFITYEYTNENNWITETFEATNLEDKNNISILSSSGLMEFDGDQDVDMFSLKKTEESLTNNGWIKE